MATRRRRRGCGTIFINLLSLAIIVLILLTIAGVVAVIALPDLAAPVTEALGFAPAEEEVPAGPTPTLVAIAVVPTATVAPTTAGLLAPTWTPQRAEPTGQPTATNTRRPTAEPSITVTLPPATNTPTITPSPTATDTPGPPPTATVTRAPFPFTSSDTSPMYLQNFANPAGCNWLGIAGEVLDLQGNPVGAGQYQVHVWGSGIDERVDVGGAPAYGPSGYERSVHNTPAIREYNVQLETGSGSPVSEAYSVRTRASCNQNLLIFNFVQNH